MRICRLQRRALPKATLWILCASVIALVSAQVPPPARPGNRETRAGFLVKAEMRNGAIITFPGAPKSANPEWDPPSNRPVARNKGKTILVLHFELQLKQCVTLDHDVMAVRENLAAESQEGNGLEAKTYRYGGWWVEGAKYTLRPTRFSPADCRPLEQYFLGPDRHQSRDGSAPACLRNRSRREEPCLYRWQRHS